MMDWGIWGLSHLCGDGRGGSGGGLSHPQRGGRAAEQHAVYAGESLVGGGKGMSLTPRITGHRLQGENCSQRLINSFHLF